MLSLFFSDFGKNGEEISPTQVISMIQNGEVEKIHTHAGVGKVKIVTNSTVTQEAFPSQADYHFKYTNVSLTKISDALESYNSNNPDSIIDWMDKPIEPSFLDQIYPYLFIGMFIIGIVFLYRMLASSNKGAM